MDCDDALSDVSTQDTRQKASQIVTGGGFGRGGGLEGQGKSEAEISMMRKEGKEELKNGKDQQRLKRRDCQFRRGAHLTTLALGLAGP
jgi:hypothetical protein